MSPADIILRKALVGSGLDSAGWSTIQAGIRDRAFFSSQVNQAKIVYAMRKNVADLVGGGKSPSEVRRDIRAYLDSIGYDAGEERGTIKDLMTKARLDVMMKTNADQAKGYASHLRATTAGAILAFPAYELIRVQQRKMPRDWHSRWIKAANAVGWDGVAKDTDRMIALKTSPVWADLSVFGNPFPPFDYNSGMGIRDIAKSVCREIGLLGKDEQPDIPPPPDFNGNLQAQIPMRNDDPEAIRLKKIFGDQIRFDGDTVHWQGELIQDVLDGKIKKTTLGIGHNGKKLSISHNFFKEHLAKHVGENETRNGNIPLEHGDYDLLPSMWRNPDRVVKGHSGRDMLELDTIDGGTLRLTVDPDSGIRSFYKMKNPKGA